MAVVDTGFFLFFSARRKSRSVVGGAEKERALVLTCMLYGMKTEASAAIMSAKSESKNKQCILYLCI